MGADDHDPRFLGIVVDEFYLDKQALNEPWHCNDGSIPVRIIRIGFQVLPAFFAANLQGIAGQHVLPQQSSNVVWSDDSQKIGIISNQLGT